MFEPVRFVKRSIWWPSWRRLSCVRKKEKRNNKIFRSWSLQQKTRQTTDRGRPTGQKLYHARGSQPWVGTVLIDHWENSFHFSLDEVTIKLIALTKSWCSRHQVYPPSPFYPYQLSFDKIPCLTCLLMYSAETCEHKNAFRTRSARTGERVSLHVRVQVYTFTVSVLALTGTSVPL